MSAVMRCKFQLHHAEKFGNGKYQRQSAGGHVAAGTAVKVKMGAVYHGDNEKQAQSENAIFGEATPHGEFVATIMNEALAERLLELVGREFYIDFTLVPVDPEVAKA